jgi:hypothetical protein
MEMKMIEGHCSHELEEMRKKLMELNKAVEELQKIQGQGSWGRKDNDLSDTPQISRSERAEALEKLEKARQNLREAERKFFECEGIMPLEQEE